MIKIQKENFNAEEEINRIKNNYSEAGAVSTFIGYVRETNNDKKVSSIELEVYEEMAKNHFKKMIKIAKQKWKLFEILIIHRYGSLKVNEKIVLVAVFSKHRLDSINACEYIMDYLKKDAPFWKKEIYNDSYQWLKNINLKN